MVTDERDSDRVDAHAPKAHLPPKSYTKARVIFFAVTATVSGLLYWGVVEPILQYKRERAEFAARIDSMSTVELLDLLNGGFNFERSTAADEFEYTVDSVLRSDGLARLSMDEIRNRLGPGEVYAACLDPKIEISGHWLTKILVPRGTHVQYSVSDPHTGDRILMGLVFQDQSIVWAYCNRVTEALPNGSGTVFQFEDGHSRVMPGY